MARGPRSAARPQRTPGFVYSALSCGMLLLIAAIAITAAQSPPPAIAELAPQAVQQIKDAPQEQSSDLGSAEGGGGANGEAVGSTTTVASTLPEAPGATTTSAPVIERARVRRCVGDPPRQIEDPQSPPCVPYWEGDNGGATSKGVTHDTIRVALPTVYNAPELRPILEGFFNKRFEFYGRRLELIPRGGGADCVEFKASAADVDSQQFFAVMDNNHNDASCFYAELARRGVVSASAPALFTESRMAELAPYVWQYLMANDRQFTAIGEMVCSRLAGGLAEHAKGLDFNQPRKFGIIVQYNQPDERVDTGPLEQALRGCGAAPVAVYRQEQSADGQENLNRSQQAILQMRRAGATSVICLCQIFLEAFLGSYATSQGYFPEWILSSYGSNDFNVLVKSVGWPNAEQRTQILGVSLQPRQLNQEEEPYWWMVKEMAPEMRREDVDQYGANIFNAYHSLLLIASGIQLAGPNLTPETFERGLHQASFPNPDHPNQAGKVGFSDRDHSMTNDAVEFWWSENDRAPDSVGAGAGGTGTICYLDQGARRDPGRWPKGPGPFFQPPCFSGA